MTRCGYCGSTDDVKGWDEGFRCDYPICINCRKDRGYPEDMQAWAESFKETL